MPASSPPNRSQVEIGGERIDHRPTGEGVGYRAGSRTDLAQVDDGLRWPCTCDGGRYASYLLITPPSRTSATTAPIPSDGSEG